MEHDQPNQNSRCDYCGDFSNLIFALPLGAINLCESCPKKIKPEHALCAGCWHETPKEYFFTLTLLPLSVKMTFLMCLNCLGRTPKFSDCVKCGTKTKFCCQVCKTKYCCRKCQISDRAEHRPYCYPPKITLRTKFEESECKLNKFKFEDPASWPYSGNPNLSALVTLFPKLNINILNIIESIPEK